MSVTTRVAIASFDDVIGSLELNVPDAATVQVAWARSHQKCAVMGLFDDEGALLDVKPDVLARLTSLIARPVSEEALRLAFPDADTETSGSVLLNVRVSEPLSAVTAEYVLDRLAAGDVVADGEVRDALWLLLNALVLPAGAVRVRRIVMVPEVVGDALFEPVELLERPDGSGTAVSWADASAHMPPMIGRGVAVFASVLAERAERASNLTGQNTVLMDALVSI
ncbi:hypothetical protein [Microbacterium gorillae]|uniref:hypothetical protein n=1 Tax=Microbacterium gorillae TaxID=1231063 RepID=UPI003D959000